MLHERKDVTDKCIQLGLLEELLLAVRDGVSSLYYKLIDKESLCFEV